MRADFEGRHELLETLPLDPAQKPLGRHRESVEGKFVFLHAAIAQHLDLPAAHAGGGKGVFVGSARLLGKEHGEPAPVG